MATTQRFQKLVHIDCSNVEEEFLDRMTGLIFEKEEEEVKMEVRCWSSADLSHYQKAMKPCDSIGKIISDMLRTVGADSPAINTEQDIAMDAYSTPRLQVIDLSCTRLQHFIAATHSNFRVFYLRQDDSFSRLQITKPIFKEFIKACDIFPIFTEYASEHRWKTRDLEIGPPPVRFRLMSEQGFEMVYVNRYAEFTNRAGRPPWSRRQFTVYHKFDPCPSRRCSTWVLVGASRRTEKDLDDYLEDSQVMHDAHPFELHLVFLNTVIASWRPYLAFLREEEAELSDIAVSVIIGHENLRENFVSIELADFQNLKSIEDEVSDAILCLDSTLDTLTTFMEMHHLLYPSEQSVNQQGRTVPPGQSRNDILMTLREQHRHVSYARKKAVALSKKAQNTRALISSILERQTSHKLDLQMVALQNVEKEAYAENAIMRQIAEKSAHDSTSVRILTIITLIYLPCTVVSSFYSTEFVNQKERPEGGVAMEYRENTWIFFAVSIPLTIFTIMVWYLWSHARRLLHLFATKRESQMVSFSDRLKMKNLLRKKRELPQ